MTGPYFMNRGKIPEVNGGASHSQAGKRTANLNGRPKNRINYVQVKIDGRPSIQMERGKAEEMQRLLAGKKNVEILR